MKRGQGHKQYKHINAFRMMCYILNMKHMLIVLCRLTSVGAVSCGDMSCRTLHTSECRLMDATSAAVIPSCYRIGDIFDITSTTSTPTYFGPDTSIGAVVQQSKNYINMASLAGKHESNESCILLRRVVYEHTFMHEHIRGMINW